MIQTILFTRIIRKASLRKIAVTLHALLLAAAAHGQTTWTGAVDSDWNNASNWTDGVPDASAAVEIPSAAHNPEIKPGVNAVAQSVYVRQGTLTIAATASLTINGATSYTSPFDFTAGLNSFQGTLINQGELVLGNVSAVGAYAIVNQGTFTNASGATIRIDRSTDTGLFNASGTFTNEGSLAIGHSQPVGYHGIWNDGEFLNVADGDIRVDRSSLRAVVANSGTLTNTGSMTIGEIADVGEAGFENRSNFTSLNACGKVRLLRGNFVHKHTSGLSNRGYLEVAGTITTLGNFNNYGVIKYNGDPAVINNQVLLVRDTPGPIFVYGPQFGGSVQGIFKDAAGTVPAGTFTAPNTFQPNETYTETTTLYAGVTTNPDCANLVPFAYTQEASRADIDIKGNGIDIASGSTTANAADHTDFGDQYFGNGNLVRTFTIENRSTTPLSLTGTPIVSITGSSDFSVTAQPAPTVQGFAQVSFEITFDPSSAGEKTAVISIDSNDPDETPYTFTIKGNGTSTCALTTATGTLTWTGVANTSWENACNWSPAAVPSADNDIVIANTGNQPTIPDGLTVNVKTVEIQAGATLTVSGLGVLSITGMKEISGANVALYNAGTVQDNGQITVGAAGGELRNEGNLAIGTCGKLDITQGLIENRPAGSITSNGMVSVGGNLQNGGTFTNNGVLHYTGISDPVVNNQLIVHDRQAPIFTYADGSAWQVLGIYLDAQGTQPAGTFAAPNSFVPGSVLVAGDNNVFAKVTDGGSCTYLVPFIYQRIVGLFTWTGNVSTDWNDAGNWSPGLPDGNSNVVIPDVTTYDPVIQACENAVVNSVLIESGASMNIDAGASLAVNGSVSYTTPFTFNFTTALNNMGSIVNAGQLLIGDITSAGNYGIVNQGAFENKPGSEIRIDRSTDTGLFNASGTFTNHANITIGANTAIGLQGIWNDAVFNHSGGEIRIDRSSARALMNNADETKSIHATFTNAAAIIIGAEAGAGVTGIENHSVFNHNAGASIRIDHAAENAIYHASGTFTSSGDITIGSWSPVLNGLSLWGDFVNSGRILVDSCSNVAINNMSGTFRNSGEIVIGGTAGGGKTGLANMDVIRNEAGGRISIDRTSDLAFAHNSGTLVNSGEIIMGSVAAVGAYGLSSQGRVDNNGGATIRVDRTTRWGVFQGGGIFNNAGAIAVGQNAPVGVSAMVVFPNDHKDTTARFNNRAGGVIKLDRAIESGLANYIATFTNEGDIVIGSQDSMMDYGVNGGLHNQSSGHIRIDRASESGIRVAGFVANSGKMTIGGLEAPMGRDGIIVTGGSTFSNLAGGEIVIDRTPYAGVNVEIGTFNNFANLSIGSHAAIGNWGVLTRGTFNNNAGRLTIDRSAEYGVLIQPASVFTNSAIVAIGSAASVGSNGIFVRGTLQNNQEGELQLDRSTQNGLLNFDGTVINSGEITIGGVAGTGTYGVVNRAAFRNNTGSKLNIDRSGDTGLYNYSIAKFDNAGAITVGAREAVGIHGIFNEAEFNNNTGGEIYIDRTSLAALRNFNGTFTNAASVTIGSNANAGSYGIRNQANFANNAGGQIRVDNTEQGIFAEDKTFTNAGAITIGQATPIGALLTEQGAGVFSNSTGGVFKGTGQIAAEGFSNAGGTLSPGYSPGVIGFDGNQDFSSGILEIEVNGVGAAGTDFDQIVVNGTAALGGTLKIASPYTAVRGDEVTILSAAAITGTFAEITGLPGEWKVVYTANAVKLQYTDPMPVTLIAFTARAAGNAVQLQWQTTAEINNAGFYIERSANGLQWEDLGFVKGNGTTAVIQNYAYRDNEPKAGLNYYRLRQIDSDGTTDYSSVRAVRMQEPAIDVTVWADDARRAHVKTDHLVEQVTIYNLSGKVVARAAATILDISQAPAGVFLVRVQTSKGAVTRKLLVP